MGSTYRESGGGAVGCGEGVGGILVRNLFQFREVF
jgi:hypothetical protein